MPDSQRPGPDSHAPERPLTPLVGALWSIALWATVSACVLVTDWARPGARDDLVNTAACVVLATSVVVFAMVRVHAREASLRATLGVSAIGPLPLLLSIAAGAGMYPLLATVDTLVAKRFPADADTSEALQKLLAVPTPAARVTLVVVVCLVFPIAEELFFRGILFGGIARAASVRVAVVGTAVFFACSFSMQDPRVLPTALALGLALGRLRERTGSVIAAVVARVAYVAVEGVPILRGRDPAADVTYPSKWIVGGAVIAALALVGVGAGARREE